MKNIWIITFTIALIASGINPKDQFTWFLEALPAIIGAAILFFTYNSFRLTPLLYFFILLHCLVLMLGAHYTYAEVPLGEFLKEVFASDRNNYDKIGHLFQGFVPALIAREIFIRKEVVNGTTWRNVLIISITLAFSAFYELIEWWVALASGEDAEAFLGTQGYIWDTQSDMAHALIAAIAAIILLSKIHDKQLKKVQKISKE